MEKIYGYVRISTEKQNMKRPLRNIQKINFIGKVTERTEIGNTLWAELNRLISITPTGTITSFNPPEYLKRTLSLMVSLLERLKYYQFNVKIIK